MLLFSPVEAAGFLAGSFLPRSLFKDTSLSTEFARLRIGILDPALEVDPECTDETIEIADDDREMKAPVVEFEPEGTSRS